MAARNDSGFTLSGTSGETDCHEHQLEVLLCELFFNCHHIMNWH